MKLSVRVPLILSLVCLTCAAPPVAFAATDQDAAPGDWSTNPDNPAWVQCNAQFGLNGTATLETILDGLTPESLNKGADRFSGDTGPQSYDIAFGKLLVLPSSIPTFVSALPQQKPEDKEELKKWKEQAKEDKARRKALADRAEDRLKDLYDDVEQDIKDTAKERDLAIRQNSTNALTLIKQLKECREWNAKSDFLSNVKDEQDSHQNTLNSADDAKRKGCTPKDNAGNVPAGHTACPDGLQGLSGAQSLEDAYRKEARDTAFDNIEEQKKCTQDGSYGYSDSDNDGAVDVNPDTGEPVWSPQAIQIPTANVKDTPEGEARNFLLRPLSDNGGGFQDVVVQYVKANFGVPNTVVATKPAIGSRVMPETEITLLVRTNKKKVPGLKKNQWVKDSAKASSAAKKGGKKGDKKKPKPPKNQQKLPKKVDTTRPTEQQVKACQERQSKDPRAGDKPQMSDVELGFKRALAEESIAYERYVDQQKEDFKYRMSTLKRNLANPFTFVIPYSNALTQVKQMTKVTELRSDRQTTEAKRSARDAAKGARDFIEDMYGVKVSY